jgi:hypothetical protein
MENSLQIYKPHDKQVVDDDMLERRIMNGLKIVSRLEIT